MMTDIREYLAHKPLLFDGGMGTYYKAAPGVECELANLTDPEGVKRVHAEYLAAGAQAIKTNTFGLPRMAAAQMPGWEELAEAGWKLACDAAAEKDAAVFADLGPALDTEAAPASSAYGLAAQQFAALGAKNFLFETLSSDVGVVEAVKALRVAVPDAFIMVSFAVLPDGYTREGLLFRDLLHRMEGSGVVDAVGLNCVSAPGDPCPHCSPAGRAGCPAPADRSRPGRKTFHRRRAGGGKRRHLPAEAGQRRKSHRH